MPLALEQLDLRGYDLIISSEAGPAKGVIAPASALHLCYCHSPMRYLWNMFHDYRTRMGPLMRLAIPPVAHYLRLWDAVSANRVDKFVANSANVAAQIRRYYGRDAAVVWPPVDVDKFAPVLVAYKRSELAVEAFNRMRKKLVVIGGGEMLTTIHRLAGPTVSVLGPCSSEELRHYFSRCQALIFPGEEDFGIVPVEAMASGRPVIAYGRGGATESVIPYVSGLLFPEQSVDAIIAAVEQFGSIAFDSERIVAHAQRFSRQRFISEMTTEIEQLISTRKKNGSRQDAGMTQTP
jgi:glycosyltransferase involved in cell wall biosynthesis